MIAHAPTVSEVIALWAQEGGAPDELQERLRTEGYVITRTPSEVRVRVGYALFESLGEQVGMPELEATLSSIMTTLALTEVA